MASKKKQASKAPRVVLTVGAVALLGVLGFGAYVKYTPAAAHVEKSGTTMTSDGGPRVDVTTQPAPSQEQQVDLLIPVVDSNGVSLGKKLTSVPSGIDSKVFLATETFSAIGIKDGRAVGVEIKDKNAVLDVNDQVVNHGFGSMEEGQFVKALQLALGQFPDIDTFQLRNAGQIVDSLGHLELSDPIPVQRPGASAPLSKTDGDSPPPPSN